MKVGAEEGPVTGTVQPGMCFPEPQGLLLSCLFTAARGPEPLPVPSPRFPFLQAVESTYLVPETVSSWEVCVYMYPSLGIHKGLITGTRWIPKCPGAQVPHVKCCDVVSLCIHRYGEVTLYTFTRVHVQGLLGWHYSGEESACQCSRCSRCRFDPRAGKSPWRKKQHPLQYSYLGNPTEDPGGLQSTSRI